MFEVVILTVIPELTQGEFDALLPLVSPECEAGCFRSCDFNSKREDKCCLYMAVDETL